MLVISCTTKQDSLNTRFASDYKICRMINLDALKSEISIKTYPPYINKYKRIDLISSGIIDFILS